MAIAPPEITLYNSRTMQLKNSVQSDTLIKADEDTLVEDELEPLYKVIVHNDNVTPYDFVIVVLIRFFNLDPQNAERITLTAHNEGVALVRVLPLKEAEKRVGQAHFAAGLEGFPLTFTIEPA